MFLLVGEVGLISAGGTKVPSKSLLYMEVNLLKLEGADLEGGLMSLTNTPAEEVCLFLIALADLTLSFVSLAIFSLLREANC